MTAAKEYIPLRLRRSGNWCSGRPLSHAPEQVFCRFERANRSIQYTL